MDPKYHPKIIGRKGAVITQIRLEHDVNIQFPDKDDGSQVRVTAWLRRHCQSILGQVDSWNLILTWEQASLGCAQGVGRGRSAEWQVSESWIWAWALGPVLVRVSLHLCMDLGHFSLPTWSSWQAAGAPAGSLPHSCPPRCSPSRSTLPHPSLPCLSSTRLL